jgi:hypothetical protein
MNPHSRAPLAAFRAAVALTLTLLPAIAIAQEPDPPPLTASVIFIPGQSEGTRVRGQLAVSLVNITTDLLWGVSIRLEPPTGGAAAQESAPVGDIEGEGTGVASLDATFDQAFLASSDPYVLRVGFTDANGTTGEALITVPRQTGGGR